MNETLTIQQALQSLKQNEIIMSLDHNRTYFSLTHNHIRCISKKAQYTLTIESFLQLYENTSFVIYTPKKEEDIDPLKDIEYYQFRK